MTDIQGDHSDCAKPPVDFKLKFSQAKAELLFSSQWEVLHKLNGHPCIWVVSAGDLNELSLPVGVHFLHV